MKHSETVTVELGDGVAVFRRNGMSAASVAVILGVERDAGGEPFRVWLDRRVHRSDRPETFVGWHVSGAFVTELVRARDNKGVAGYERQ